METMTFTVFKKEVQAKGNLQQVLINPYFNLESWFAKSVFISNQVSEITTITYRRKPIAIVIPDKGNVRDSLQPYFSELQRLVRVVAPIISVFDTNGKKIAQLEEEKVVIA